MDEVADPRPWPVIDWAARLELGLERGRDLLSADEIARVEAWLGLAGDDALLLARLTGRRTEVWRVPDLDVAGIDDLDGALARGLSAGWLTDDVPWPVRADAATRAVLSEACRRLRLPRSGARATLQARLEGAEDWDDARWIAVADGALSLRLERWATLRVVPDRSAEVLERLGTKRWATYRTTARRLVPDRAAWDAWEDLVARWEDLTPDEGLAALERPHWPPGRLDVRRALARRVRDQGHALERAGDLAAAEAVQAGLVARGWGGVSAVQRWARVRELGGDVAGAYGLVVEAHASSRGADRLLLAKTGRRLAKGLGRAWVPDPPRRRGRQRTLRLDRVDSDGVRPRYATAFDDDGTDPGSDALVEAAVVACVEAAGRRVVRAEGGWVRTLGGILTADAAFADVPGALPAPRLPGPLDHGRPDFAAARAGAIQALWDDLGEGRAVARFREAWSRWHGVEVRGVDWDRADLDTWTATLEGLGPRGVKAILGPWLRDGSRAGRGFPDLVVLPGPPAAVPGLHPATLPDAVVAVEVKGETDTLREGQLVWLDRLVRGGVAAEVWKVVPR